MRHPGKSVSNITNAQSQSRADISAGRGSKNENRPSPTIGGNPTNLPKSQPGDGKIKQLVAGRCKIKQSELNENVNDNSTKYTAIKTTHFKRCFIFSCFIATMCILSIWSLTTHNTHCDVHYSNVHNYTSIDVANIEKGTPNVKRPLSTERGCTCPGMQAAYLAPVDICNSTIFGAGNERAFCDTYGDSRSLDAYVLICMEPSILHGTWGTTHCKSKNGDYNFHNGHISCPTSSSPTLPPLHPPLHPSSYPQFESITIFGFSLKLDQSQEEVNTKMFRSLLSTSPDIAFMNIDVTVVYVIFILHHSSSLNKSQIEVQFKADLCVSDESCVLIITQLDTRRRRRLEHTQPFIYSCTVQTHSKPDSDIYTKYDNITVQGNVALRGSIEQSQKIKALVTKA